MIEKAVKFAIKAHEGQFRKGSTIPCILPILWRYVPLYP